MAEEPENIVSFPTPARHVSAASMREAIHAIERPKRRVFFFASRLALDIVALAWIATLAVAFAGAPGWTLGRVMGWW